MACHECVRCDINVVTVLSAPGAFPPLRILSVPHTDFIHLCEKVMRNVLLVVVLGAQKELHSLGGSVCRQKEKSELTDKLEVKSNLHALHIYNFDEMHHKGETLCPPPGWGPDPRSSSCACCHDVDVGDGCGAGCSPGGRGPRCRVSCGLRAHCSEVRGGSTAMHMLSVDLHDPSSLGDHALALSLCAAPLGLMLLWRFVCISWMF